MEPDSSTWSRNDPNHNDTSTDDPQESANHIPTSTKPDNGVGHLAELPGTADWVHGIQLCANLWVLLYT